MRLVMLLALLILPSAGSARTTAIWTYEAMFERSDLVVIAVPMSVMESNEVEALPNVSPEKNVFVVTTEFSTSVVLKGTSINRFQLRHYKLVNPYQSALAGPSFISFDPAERHSYLMFLKLDEAGTYAPVTGQADATVAIIKLQGSAR